MVIQENIELAGFTTIHLGGPAKYFCSCSSIKEISDAMEHARENNLRVHILGGGSNTIFSDKGFDGLVIKIGLKGISVTEDQDHILVSAQGGEDWDPFVAYCVEKGYGGLECLSGIPGSVGATPIQNVGAYGQEVKDTIVRVRLLERSILRESEMSNAECIFSYRHSRFKHRDQGKYIVTEVTFRLNKNGKPTINYPEVKNAIASAVPLSSLADGHESLLAVRNVVLSLRRKKSMVIDPGDVNTRSVGSFFVNPVVTRPEFERIDDQWKIDGDGTAVPVFEAGEKYKIPAAWLIERSGFRKGMTKNGAGISEHHSLALVNRGGTAEALLALAEEIRNGVERRFSIRLEMEPIIVQ
jgi:UDP-N-acetylmuramate dehydrogenase